MQRGASGGCFGDVVATCMCLHNICIDARQASATRCTEPRWSDEDAQMTMHLQEYSLEGALIGTRVPKENMAPGRRRDLETSQRREMLVMRLRNAGRTRPAYSKWGRGSARARAIEARDAPGTPQ